MISTHTPAWGVTACRFKVVNCRSISTHTPAWGVTPEGMLSSKYCQNFNSHARVGRDAYVVHSWKNQDGISTHTPAWGVTWLSAALSRRLHYFNSHARVGRD